MNKVLFPVVCIILLVLIGRQIAGFIYGHAQPSAVGNQQSTPSRSPADLAFELREMNSSGEHGVVTIKEIAHQAVILLTLEGYPDEVVQPTSVYYGSCDKPGAIMSVMTVPDAGESETDLNMTLAEFQAKMPLTIIIYKSTMQNGVPIACADIN